MDGIQLNKLTLGRIDTHSFKADIKFAGLDSLLLDDLCNLHTSTSNLQLDIRDKNVAAKSLLRASANNLEPLADNVIVGNDALDDDITVISTETYNQLGEQLETMVIRQDESSFISRYSSDKDKEIFNWAMKTPSTYISRGDCCRELDRGIKFMSISLADILLTFTKMVEGNECQMHFNVHSI
jgi:hypothetical protein